MTIQRDYEAYLTSLNSAKFRALYENQKDVLAQYVATYSTREDVAVELPTGSGKTPISLLVAGAWREAGKKVAVLSANKTLARQMASEARELGIPLAYMEGRGEDIPIGDRRAYQRAQRVGIMNYWVYFNQNPVIDPADLLVMDDAHLAEHCLHSLYSVEISKFEHRELFTSLVTELQERFPAYATLSDALDDAAPPSSTAELLSFIDQSEAADRVREILDAATRGGDADLKFRWRRLRPKLHEVNLYISQHSLWLRPYVYPLISNPYYKPVQQALYMSATVGDPGDLARRLGTRPIHKIPVAPKHSERTAGRRLVVINRTSDEKQIPDRMAGALLAAIRRHPKSLWLCNSEVDATRVRAVVDKWLVANGAGGHPLWTLTSMGDEVDQFRRAPGGHLFVAGRFDGMDFKGDECRIVVITTLPRAINLQEEFITSYLRDAGFMRRRLNQRIVQALGRCNRDPADFGVYFLADQRFATHFSREANREGLSRNLQAEIDLAQDIAELSDAKVVARVEQFLDRDFSTFDAEVEEREGHVPLPPLPTPPKNTDTSADEVLGWAALDSQNYPLAAERFEACWEAAKRDNILEFGALHGWHRAKALYLQGRNGDSGALARGLQALEDAIKRGGQSSWFNRMRSSLLRARADEAAAAAITEAEYAEALLRNFDELLERLGPSGGRYQKYVDRIAAALASPKHSEYQQGLEELGKVLGYAATRPTYGTATDCRWRGAFGQAREVFTFEAKIEHTAGGKISASDLGQAHNQRTRAEGEFTSSGYTVRSAIVTHMTELHDDAVGSVGPIVIIAKDGVLALWRRISAILSSYRAAWSLQDMSVRTRAAAGIRPSLPRTGWLVRALATGEPFVASDALTRGWQGRSR